MEILHYFLKSSIILALFYSVYYLFLRKDTLFAAKRLFFITGLITALVLPFLTITKKVFIEIPAFEPATVSTLTLEDLEMMATTTTIIPEQFKIDWWQVTVLIYCMVCVFFAIRFFTQLASLFTLFNKAPSVRKEQFKYIEVTDKIAPFSFFNYIVYNPSLHSQEELQMILAHEQIHSKQFHTIDIFLSQFLTIIQWANPFAWLYKKAIEANLEFVADAYTIPKITSKKQYQLTLVKASSSIAAPALTSPFYQSLIKKRILMLNKTTTHRRNVLKMTLVLPLLAFFLFSFNIKEEITYTEASTTVNTSSYIITSETLSSEIYGIENNINASTDAFEMKLTDIQRNSAGNITELAISTKFKNQNAFTKNVTYGGDNIQIGDFKLTIEENQLQFSDLEELTVMRATENGVMALKFQKQETPSSIKENMGDNPLYVINGEETLLSELPKDVNYEVSESVEAITPKNAMAKYGTKAKDGAVVFNGTTTIRKDKPFSTQLLTNQAKPKSTLYHLKTTTKNDGIIIPSIFKYIITKNTTDAELERIKRELKSKYNTVFKYSVTRNSKNEITAISITHNDSKGNSGSHSINDNTPIKDLTFYKTDTGFGFGQAKDQARLAEMLERKEELIGKRNHMAIERREMLEEKRGEMREKKEELRAKRNEIRRAYGIGKRRDTTVSRFNSIHIDQDGDKPTIIVDGVVYKGDIKGFKADDIAKINVIKDIEGMNRFGVTNDNGIIVIDTKAMSEQASGWAEDLVFDFTTEGSLNTENIYITKNTTKQDLENIKNEMSAKGKDFNYKRVKRNAQGEITNIKIIFDDNSGNKQSLSKQGNGNSPIKDILIAY